MKHKERSPPTKVLWYLSIIPRFKHLFANGDDTKDLTWHADERNCDEMLCHPTDSSQWKKINNLYSDFGNESLQQFKHSTQFVACFSSNLQLASMVVHAKIHDVVYDDM